MVQTEAGSYVMRAGYLPMPEGGTEPIVSLWLKHPNVGMPVEDAEALRDSLTLAIDVLQSAPE
jgi:hypothetical protein